MADDPDVDGDGPDLLELARGILERLTLEERAEIQEQAELNQISEEYVILEAILRVDLSEFGETGSGTSGSL